MSNPGSHQKGPIVSAQGFSVGKKASKTNMMDASGNLVNIPSIKLNDNSKPVLSQSIKLDTAKAGDAAYSADILLPAGHIIHNISVICIAVNDAAGTATLVVGDYEDDVSQTVRDADGFFTGINLKATDLTATQGIDFFRTGGKQGAYLAYSTSGQHADSHVNELYFAAARRIRASCAISAGAAATTGSTLITVTYSLPAFVEN